MEGEANDFPRGVPRKSERCAEVMKVYFGVNGLGLGHMIRCQALADELSAAGAEVLFSTYLDGLEFARRKRLKAVESIPIFYRVRQDGSVDLRATTSRSGFSLGVRRFLRQLVQEIQHIKRYKPDLVLADTRLSSLIAARLLGKRVVLILNQYKIRLLHNNTYPRTGAVDRLFLLIARLGWTFFGTLMSEMWGLAEKIIIPDFPEPLTISKYNLAMPRRHARKAKFVGPIVRRQLNRDFPIQLLKRKYGFNPEELLIYASISGPKHEREPLIKKLMPVLGDLSEGFNVVVSCGNPAGHTSRRYFKRMPVYDWADNQDDLLHACDMLICRAGQSTILKALTVGKPLLLIPTPFQTEQLGNADRARSIGTAVVLGQDDLSNESVRGAINRITNSRAYFEKASQIASRVRETDAISECMRIIEHSVTRES
jgi:UDP-N-acetylglucosamine--N-acetylmuramyl-(pentapeptide) pyrophosphoryl-undecaprenol N-acetylglucosamine transferase